MTGSTVSIRLRAYRGEQHDTAECFNGLRDEAADLIDSLIAERDALREQVKLTVGKTALRCIEMAKWPQGLYDEQAYYGGMFAEFIEKEFRYAIDAARSKE